jgi:transposase-like protein
MKEQGERWLARAKDQRWTQEDAERVLSVVAASGESIEAFARRHELVPERLYRWRRRLGDARPRATAAVAGASEAAQFIPVVVRGAGSGTAAVAITLGALKIEVADPGSVPPTWLASLVAELGGVRS